MDLDVMDNKDVSSTQGEWLQMVRRPTARSMAMLMTIVALAAGVASAAPASAAAQRIDLKVLVLGTSTTEPDLVSWQGALRREGVPFETIVTSAGHAPITAATLSDTLANGTQEAKYQAVIVAVGGLPLCTESGCESTLSPTEWTALEAYEQAFNIRQITGDVFPGSTYGLNSPTASGTLDGTQGTLTAEGNKVFPYLKGSVSMDTGTYGYEATPLATQASGASFAPLLSGPEGSAFIGVYTHPNGVQEMVESFNENSFQLQAELLRHGALNWATRGVYFGDQRNYYEADVDDNFLPDDSWNPATHTTDYNPANALREVPADVAYAASWAQQNNFRIDMLFNGGGSAQYAEEHGGSDPLRTAFAEHKGAFGWISHTWDHPNLDVGCATQSYIEAELNENTAWGTSALGLTQSTSATAALGSENPSVIITGEHSGLANLLPGNPGVVDPPDLDTATAASSSGTLPAGSYVYAVTDDFAPGAGQSSASESAPVTVTGSTGSVTLTWAAVCHAAEFKIYREVAGSNEWQLLKTVATPTQAPPNSSFSNPTTKTAVTGGGPLEQSFTDTGAAGAASSGPPASNEAFESAYPQNPGLIPAFAGVKIQYFGSDASKPYPNPAIAGSTAAAYAAGETFLDGTARAIPRYPTNIYYNVSTEAQELDEFNTLYTPVADGGLCVASATTTCETSPTTFAGVVSNVDTNMFQHVMGNDPRPHYFHQPNLMGSPPAGEATTGTPPGTSPSVGDGLFYSVLNPLLAEYRQYFSAPLEQPTMAQIGALLAEQVAWSKANTGQVTGYIEGSQITIQNSGTSAISLPLTGVTGVGSVYGGIQSGWTSVPAKTSILHAPTAWPEALKVTANPASKSTTAGENATFTAAASGAPTPTVQWQVSTDGGVTFANDTADAGSTTGTLTVASTTVTESGREYRAVFTNATGSVTSTAATLTVKAAPPTTPIVSGVSSYSLGPLKFALITGKNFTNVQAVYFGSKPSLSYALSSTQILALAPAGSGTVDITIKTTSGTSAISSADRFKY
jgi:Immunoglobulin I-set domain